MKHVYDYGEGFLCFLPVFVIIAAVGLALLWNSLPDRTIKKKTRDEESPE